MNDAFVLGAAVVDVNVRTDKLRQGYVQATREAEQAGDRMGQEIAQGVDAGAVKAARSINKMGREIDDAADKAGRSIEDGITSRLNRMASVATGAFGAFAGGVASVLSADMIGRIGRELIQTASNAEEAENKFNVAFGSMAESVRAWSEEAADRMGRSGLAFRDASSQVALVTTAIGNTTEQIEEMATKLTERSVDIGSIFNVDDADAMRAIVSALTGEAEGVKRFGVVLNAAALEAQLLANGVKGGAEEATEAQKAFARYQIIIRDTAVAHGDAERTAGGFANSSKRLQAEIEQLKLELGQELLPIMQDLLQGTIDLVRAFNAMDPAARNMAVAAAAAVALLGPAVVAVTNLLLLLRQVPAAAATAAAASAGAARASALALGAAGVAGVAIGQATDAGNSTMNDLRIARARPQRGETRGYDFSSEEWSDENLAAAIQQLDGQLPDNQRGPRGQITGRSQTARDLRALRDEQARRDRLRNEQLTEARAMAGGAAEAAQHTAAIAAGATTGTDTGTGRRRSTGRSAADRARDQAAAERAQVEEQIGREAIASERETLQARRSIAANTLDQLEIDAQLLDLRYREEQAALDELRAAAVKNGISTEQIDAMQRDLDARKEIEKAAIALAMIEEATRQEAERRAATLARKNETLERRVNADLATIDAQIESARIELEGAETRREAKRILDQIADLERERRDLVIEAIYQQEVLNGAVEEEARARRDAALELSRARAGADNRRTDAQTQGPMADYLDRLRRETEDGFEKAQVGFLEDLNRNLVDVAMGAKKAEDALRDMVLSFLAELIKLQVNKAFLALFEGEGAGGTGGSRGGGGGGGDWIATAINVAAKVFGGGRMSGGDARAGMFYRVNENTPQSEFFAPRVDGAIWNPTQLGQLGGMMQRGGGPSIIYLDAGDFGVRKFVVDTATGTATAAAVGAVQAAPGMTAAAQKRVGTYRR